ncbi:nucleolar protein 6-like isoform X1 [Zingiber officinale]|uniref:nucleolar protein 6-like isoform X1 n=2 Tax=Zingiber officinale TaxID=94328 RepID=UPI001C4A9E11|nr:nucleolar protein 6-like isoform X1 [Zingiber officinale]
MESDSMDFKLGELLKEVQLDDSIVEIVDLAVASVVDAIKSIPERLVRADEASRFIADLGVPSEKVSFTFRVPESIQVGGSHLISSVAKPDINVDLLVRMPKGCFHEKDYLNHRYHAKRFLYLRVIEKSLESCSAVKKIAWSSFQNEGRKPVLIIFPVMDSPDLSECFIRIIPTATSLFSMSRLSLSRNNVRSFSQEDGLAQATPIYNSSILEDMFLEENSEYVQKTFHEWKVLKEALILLKVWARNRNSLYSHDSLNGYLISMILSHLVVGSGESLIHKSMNVMQIFRVTLKFIATLNLKGRPLFLHPQGHCNIAKEDLNQLVKSFDTVLLDASCSFNLLFRMTKTAFVELQDEVSWTLKCIDKCRGGGFEEIFMTKVDFAAKFDSCLRINLKANPKICSGDFCMDNECWRIYEKNVQSLLQRGLSDRAKLVRVVWRSTPLDWNIEDGLSYFGNEPIIVGILISSQENSFRVVDIGPNPENKEEAMKFRKFWGEKAELRRFKDGAIAESTVWECEPWERHLIIKRICDYLISKHLLLSKEDIVHVVDQLDFCLQVNGKDPVAFSSVLLEAFELLSKRLRLLEDIPLKISSVQPLDPAFRHTSVFPPQPHPLAYETKYGKKLPKSATTCIPTLEVMIQLEGSGNWPLDSVAIEKTKSAFLLKIGESLEERWSALCVAAEDEVNILMSGYSFCLRIMHEKGLNMLQTQGVVDKNETFSIDKKLFMWSQHSSMINGLHGCYPTYGPVVRLAKRWVAAHLFSSFLEEEAVELIVAYLFLKPFPFHAPCSRVTGFLRFLRFLSCYDWTFSPLIIDINGDLTLKDENEINENFISRGKYYEENKNIAPSMFLAAPYDKTSKAWTRLSPNRSELKRICSYARSSADLLTNLILRGADGPYTWECLFRTPLNNYDAVVVLHHDKLSTPQHLLFPAVVDFGKLVICGKASNLFLPYTTLDGVQSLEEARNKLMVGFDPTRCFLEDLKREFPTTFKIWYDSLGGDVLGLTCDKKDSRKRGRDGADESSIELTDALKKVGEVGKGLVKSVHLVKVPKLQQ